MTIQPIRLGDHVFALPLPANLMGGVSLIHPALLLDDREGATLVDTGVPGMEGVIEEALSALSLSLSDVRRVVVTHHDLDHIGSLPSVLSRTNADVLALEAEVPYVQGDLPSQKQPSPERLAAMPPAMKAVFENPPRARVTRVLHDGDVLNVAGGVDVVATPGHTFGHLSLFVRKSGVLIAGDALTSANGELHPPMERATPDMETAMRSLGKLATLPVRAILTYHGGVVSEDAASQLRRVAG
ncbi:MBL fold metallo-hydrolase [Deinococcus yavapaiensis]|uniref:Glyoxylase-like metal-dependent hydrolase (Beta-lactamase superfamily II) n=1 Tax=Deinococcus yavapaiensis KR-236 TaxID=694435 RepID=A0A318SGI7_9DEIO|nr:MBL fold metallo-hydrolase [Deinococcus yavapaiensis]PYE49374.1 glyoxylase-like metal-dependent hydrolase (beta-lactamase superfamily II) [Deinococcus yavapaiensis KR-236]